ncbi:MAG: galactokinase [Defluviitaleaceae bacterium]|nr:galactokinase [Defluviitaleaceae bacterium]
MGHLIKDLQQKFIALFGDSQEDIRYFHAPGRINIIGEHIDYNGGYVLPCAISMGTYALFRKRGDQVARFASTNFEQAVDISLESVAYEPSHDWANYPKGVLHSLQHKGCKITGFDVLFSGNIPNGAGLSSSASIELVMATALNVVFSLGFEMLDLVKIAQYSENNFCGVNCGIMDQFAVGMGKKDFAIYLHCNSLDYEYIPLNLGDYKIIIMDTNKRRRLNESKYNERRAECEEALKILPLTDLSPEHFDEKSLLIKDEIIRKRAKHVVYENARVKQAITALNAGNIHTLGELLTASHNSLRYDYEVSCIELDTIVNIALQTHGCIGARMTGAGFGGCAIALVNRKNTDDFIKTVSSKYEKAISYAPSLYLQESGDGAREEFLLD